VSALASSTSNRVGQIGARHRGDGCWLTYDPATSVFYRPWVEEALRSALWGRRTAVPGCGMPVPEDVDAFLVASHPDLADLALWVREVVLAGEPDLTERVYSRIS
jgi:hypothetical protein